VIVSPELAPPTIEQPAPFQVSYGLVTGRAAAGTTRIVVSANGRTLASKPLHRRRFSLRLALPVGDDTVGVTTLGHGRRSSARVRNVFGLPPGSQPRVAAARADRFLARKLDTLRRGFGGTAGVYVQSLTGGAGAAANAGATFPAASTLKLAIATTVLARSPGLPARGSYVCDLLGSMIERSDNEAANELEVWLGGSTSGGSGKINALMRSIGLTQTEMYGGYEVRTLSDRIPVRTDDQPAYGYGKHTTARDLATLLRAIWLASGGRGPLRAGGGGFTATDARYLLWLLAHVDDGAKLDRVRTGNPGVVVMHKAGWVSDARHDAGLVFWRGGVFVASVLTWNARGVGASADVLAGRVARVALERFRGTGG
jgi:beta-lactamase class A